MKMKEPRLKRSDTKKVSGFTKRFQRDWQLHLLISIPLIYLIIFHYVPIYGAQIAFRDYRARRGIWGSEWVGLKWFKQFLGDFRFGEILTNTVVLSIYNTLLCFVLAVMLALLLNSLRSEKIKKFTQTITYIPHFISVVVLVSMFQQIFNPINGLYGTLHRLFGGTGYPEDFRGLAGAFRHIYVLTTLWQQLGWQTIIYTSALSSVDPGQHEAAIIDGATRWQRLRYIDWPGLVPTACTMLILNFGNIMSVGFEKVYLLQGVLNRETSEVISTYVYKVGMGSGADFSYGAAIGLFNSVVNCALLIFVNWLTKKLSADEMGLF